MSEELKPVRCGCGGEAFHDTARGWNPVREDALVLWHRVICKNCGTQTKAFYTEAEAIQAWNRAISGQNKEKDMTFHWIESFLGYRCSSCGHICNTTAMPDICPNCHARLEWN